LSDETVLRAVDGSNPLGFLAALGTLRLLTLEIGEQVQIGWERLNGCWRPKLRGIDGTEEELCDKLAGCRWWAPAADFVAHLGKNITVPRGKFKPFAEKAGLTATLRDRRIADFAAAFGSEVCEEEGNDRIERTDFCFITGSGHQDFLGTIAALQANVTPGNLCEALFEGWLPEKGLSMRWDPADAAEYAMQWNDPGPKGAWSVRGANRLAAEALPLLPTAPVRGGLQTAGFKRRKRQDEFTWPIWRPYIGCASVRSLLSLAELQKSIESKDGALLRERLSAMGIEEVYRAQRVRIGQGANFKVSFRPARSV
jgi:hypothetical protein